MLIKGKKPEAKFNRNQISKFLFGIFDAKRHEKVAYSKIHKDSIMVMNKLLTIWPRNLSLVIVSKIQS